MNKAASPVDRIKMGVGIVLLAILTGCVGYVGGYGGPVIVPDPGVYFWGGGYAHEDVHVYSQRGAESRGRR